MRRRRRSAPLLPLLLVAVCFLLVWKIHRDWQAAPAAAVALLEEASQGSSTRVAANAAPVPPPEEFAVIAERPLFSPARRPWQPPAVETPPEPEPVAEITEVEPPPREPEPAAEPEPPPVIEFVLVGTVISGADRHALVRQRDGKVVQVPEGGEIAGWFAVLVEPGRARFRQRGYEEEQVLKYDTPVPAELVPPPRPTSSRDHQSDADANDGAP